MRGRVDSVAVGAMRLARRVRFFFQTEQVTYRIDDPKPAAICGSGTKSNGRSVQELVHQGARELLHRRALLRRHFAKTPERIVKLPLPDLIHLSTKTRQDGNG